jgi:cell division protein FtsB
VNGTLLVPTPDITERIIGAIIDHSPTIITFLVGGIAFVLSLRSQLSNLGKEYEYVSVRLENVEKELKVQTEILSTQAAQTARLDAQDVRMSMIDANVANLRQDIRDLRFGRGFVLEGPAPHS